MVTGAKGANSIQECGKHALN